MFAHTEPRPISRALIFAPVLRYDQHGEFVPELATLVPTYATAGSAAIEDDHPALAPRRRWSDGAPLTAADRRFTWQAVMNPRNTARRTSAGTTLRRSIAPDVHDRSLRSNGLRRSLRHLRDRRRGVSAAPGASARETSRPQPRRASTSARSRADPLLERWRHGLARVRAEPALLARAAARSKNSSEVVPDVDTLFNELITHEVDVDPTVNVNDIARLQSVSGITGDRHRLIANWRTSRTQS